MPNPRIDRRYAAWLGLLLLLVSLPAFAGFGRIGWELGELAGYLGALACIFITGAPVRPRSASPPALVSLHRHTVIGWVALGAVAVHVAVLLLADHVVLQYLKPSAPLYQLAGIVAALALLFLAVSGTASVRRRLWHSHRGFQATHILLAYAAAALMTAHVVVSARYLGGGVRRSMFAAAAAGAVLMLLRARRPASAAAVPQPAPVRHPLAFGRHSPLIAAGAISCVALLAALLPRNVDATLREPIVRRGAALALAFPHEKHGAVNCLTCHHNYADGRGMQACIECHRSGREDLKEGVEARFHAFCLGCHRHPQATLRTHGPVDGCAVCHRP